LWRPNILVVALEFAKRHLADGLLGRGHHDSSCP
jgi:hypothetical protein